MKKLALLLGALSLVSSVAYAKEVVPAVEEVVVVEEAVPVAAAPALRVTSIGQYVEVDNASGHDYANDNKADIGEEVYFGNVVNFAYGEDWTFQLLAHKTWSMDTDDGIHGADHRIEIGGWRNFDNFALGMKWRNQETYDRLYLRGKYNFGMFDGWADVAYQANNEDVESVGDQWYSEGEPIAVTVGPVRFAYYYELNHMLGDIAVGAKEDDIVHQVRASLPVYQGEKLSLGLEYRYQFAHDEEYNGTTPWQETTKHIGIVKAAYAVNENLTLDGYYRYDFRSYEAKDGDQPDAHDDYYGEFYAGWTYTF